MTVDTAFIVVPRAEFEELKQSIAEMRDAIQSVRTDTSLRMRVMAMSANGVLKSSAIGKIMGWSQATVSRRIASGELPMTLDGSRYIIAVDEFIAWYQNYLLTKA